MNRDWGSTNSNPVGAVSGAIPEAAKQMVRSYFKREDLRSIKVFFGMGEEKPFFFEKSPGLLIERIRKNLGFFFLNYLVVAFLAFCLSVVTSPMTLIGIAILAVVWLVVFRATQSGTLTVSSM